MFEIKETEDMSDLEYIAEFMGTYPDQAALISQDQFPVFYQHPKLVLRHFRAAIQFMINLQIPKEVIEHEFEYHLNNACKEVANLIANDSQNS